jgi:hypothetical protein
VSHDSSADEITGGKAPRGHKAESYKNGYCSNGVAQYSRNIAFYKQDFRHIRLGQSADDRALRRLRWMGRRAYAQWLVDRQTPCPPYHFRKGVLIEGNEPPAPFVSKTAEYYRLKGMSIPDVIAQMPKPGHFPKSWREPRLDLATLELKALERRMSNALLTAKPKKHGLAA